MQISGIIDHSTFSGKHLDILWALLVVELYWDMVLIIKSIHEKDIANFDIKCANFVFKEDNEAEDQLRAAEEHRQKQLIEAEEEDIDRVAEQTAEAAELGIRLKSQWDYHAKLEELREEVNKHCNEESERRTKHLEQLSLLKAKRKNGKNPKVKAAYTVDIDALEAKIKAERAERKVQETNLAEMQAHYEELKAKADTFQERHLENNARRAASRAAKRAALGMDIVESLEEVSLRRAKAKQVNILVNLIRSLSFMRACHLNGQPSGVLLLIDFGESTPYSSSISADAGDYDKRCRGTLPIQSPEFLSINSNDGRSSTPTSVPVSPKNPGGNLSVVSDTKANGRKRIPLVFPKPGIASDVWSLGCLLPELCTGTYLFENRPWTEMYVSLCTVKPATQEGVVSYDIEGNIDVSAAAAAPIVDLPLDGTMKQLTGGKNGLFADKYSGNEQKSSNDNLDRMAGKIMLALQSSLRRMPSDRCSTSALSKLIENAAREVYFHSGDIESFHVRDENVLPERCPHGRVCIPPGPLPTEELSRSQVCLSSQVLKEFSGIIEPINLRDGTASILTRLACSAYSACSSGGMLALPPVSPKGESLHVICFTKRSAIDKDIEEAALMVADGAKDTYSKSNGSEISHINDADGHVHHVHTELPRLMYHEHEVVDLNTSDPVLMRQWSDIHDEWLHRYELWEQPDQDQLDDPYGTIVAGGGRIVGILTEGVLAASTAFKPIGSPIQKRWELIKMAVHPAYRGQGLGKQLLRWTLNYLIEQIRKAGGGRGSIVLESSSKLKAALTLYRSHGFVTTHQRDLNEEAAKRAAWEAECEAIRLEAQKTWGNNKVTFPKEPKSNFPSPYTTADIIMECTLDPSIPFSWRGCDALSPRMSQSVVHALGGGSLRFVHVSGDVGTLDDIGLAILDIVAERKRMPHSHFLVLIDPLEDEPAPLGHATYDCVCVAGAAVLANKLDPVGAQAGLISTICPHSEALAEAVRVLESKVNIE
eukprot:GSChrysophyteH1.ASY1.ANO1.187.1 assembled CDS